MLGLTYWEGEMIVWNLGYMGHGCRSAHKTNRILREDHNEPERSHLSKILGRVDTVDGVQG